MGGMTARPVVRRRSIQAKRPIRWLAVESLLSRLIVAVNAFFTLVAFLRLNRHGRDRPSL